MSMFYCHQCDELCDADDGCEEHPTNPLELICIDCAMSNEADAEEAEDVDAPTVTPSPDGKGRA